METEVQIEADIKAHKNDRKSFEERRELIHDLQKVLADHQAEDAVIELEDEDTRITSEMTYSKKRK